MTPSVRALYAAFALPLTALSLSGCGFTPLYAGAGVTPGLAAVDFVTPNTRVGFLLRQSLQDEMASKGAPLYRLDCKVTERRFPRGVRVNNVANRYEIDLTVNYVLTEMHGGKTVLNGSAPVIVTYDSADPPYAGVVASQNGDERAAQQAAIQVRLALSRYFAGRPAAAPAITETPNMPTLSDDTP